MHVRDLQILHILVVGLSKSSVKKKIHGQMLLSHSIIVDKIQKHFQNVTLVGMASENSKNYTYKHVDRSRHNRIKGAKAKCAH